MKNDSPDVDALSISQEDTVESYSETYGYLLINELEERWKEIDLIIEEVKDHSEEAHINVLCRSAVVLLVAHLEGFIKEAASVVVKDINYHASFAEIPKSIQKTHSMYFLDSTKDDNIKLKRLLDEFEELNAKILVDPFLFEQNKNPSPTIIEKIMVNFGVKDFFGLLNKSKLDVVFENNSSETEELLRDLKDSAIIASRSYPYKTDLIKFDICTKDKKMKRKDSLWVTFLDELLRLRHSIAHGSTFSNEITINNLIDYKQKVTILQYGIALVLFNSSVK